MDLSTSSVSVVMLLLSSVFVQTSSTQTSERTFPRIVSSKLQLFDHDSLTVTCEGFFIHTSQWKVVRTAKGSETACNKNDKLYGPCHISEVYPSDSGEYWCESKNPVRRSESVNITVTADNLVLESPVHPVMVGDNVTLRCIEKKDIQPSSEFYFYKDDVGIHTSPTGEMKIHNISVNNQGLYKCSTAEGDASAQSLLQVRAVFLQIPDRPVMNETNITLICKDKMATANHMSSFYKDGEIIGNSSSGQWTLVVSKSDEGVYKCRGSEGRESEEQWLAVTGSATAGKLSKLWFTQPSLIGLIALPLVLTVFWFIYKKYKERRVSDGTETASVVMKPKPSEEAETGAIYSEISDVEESPHDSNGPESASERGEFMYSTVNMPEENTSCEVDTRKDLYSTVNKKKKGCEVDPKKGLYSTVNKKKKNSGADSKKDLYSTVNKKKKKGDAKDVAALYSVVKKNKGKKLVDPSPEAAADDSFYAPIL